MYEPCQDLGRGLGSRKTGLSPPVMVLLTVPRRCSWCGSCLSDLNTGLFHIIIVNYDDIPDDLFIKVILAQNTSHLVAASMSTYDAQITWWSGSQVYVIFGGSGFIKHHWPYMTTGKTGRQDKARHVTLDNMK